MSWLCNIFDLFSSPWIRIRISNMDPDPEDPWIRIRILNTVKNYQLIKGIFNSQEISDLCFLKRLAAYLAGYPSFFFWLDTGIRLILRYLAGYRYRIQKRPNYPARPVPCTISLMKKCNIFYDTITLCFQKNSNKIRHNTGTGIENVRLTFTLILFLIILHFHKDF